MTYIVIWSGGYEELQLEAFLSIDLATDAYNSWRDEMGVGHTIQLFSIDAENASCTELASVTMMNNGVLV